MEQCKKCKAYKETISHQTVLGEKIEICKECLKEGVKKKHKVE